MRRIVGIVSMAAWLVVPLAAQAAVFEQSENTFSLEAPLGDDLYVGANTIEIGQQVDGDIFAGANAVEVSATVTEDVYAAGETVRVSGDVRDDLHMAGARLEVTGRVSGDVFAAGETITIGPEASIGGNLYVVGNLMVEDGARVTGETFHKIPQFERPEKRDTVMGWVRAVLALFVLGLVLLYGAKHLTSETLATLKERTGRTFLIGILWTILFVPASILLLVTLVGWPLALALVALSVLMYVLAVGLASLAIGRWVMSKLSKTQDDTELTWSHALIGAVIYEGVQLIGGIGWLLTFILVLFVLGAAILTLAKHVRGDEN